jgi:MazG family protein
MQSTQVTAKLNRLIEIMIALRAPSGCPWDREQTAASLKPYLLEEAYELLEAIDSQQPTDIRDELGDLLLQVVFLARIHEEAGLFDIGDVAESISNKLTRRHPHVFADADQAGHKQRWEEIKQEERRQQGKQNRLAARIPKNLPALKQAAKVASKTKPENPDKLLSNIDENLTDLRGYLNFSPAPPVKQAELYGKLLYGVVQLGTLLQLDAEDALRQKTAQTIKQYDAQNDARTGQQFPSS